MQFGYSFRLISVLLAAIFILTACGDDNPAGSDGDVADGDASDGDMLDGDATDGDGVDGDVPDGDKPDGDDTDGDTLDGDVDGDADSDTDGDIIVDGDADAEPELEELGFAVTIEPTESRTGDDLLAVLEADSDDDHLELCSFAYAWARDDQAVENTTNTIAASETAKGQKWRVNVTATCDGTLPTERSAEITILNTAPVVAGVEVQSDDPSELGELTCAVIGASDVDDDIIGYSYGWTVNETPLTGVSGATLTGVDFDKNDVVSCSVTPSDDEQDGLAVAATNSITILDTPATISSVEVTPAALYSCSVAACEFEWSDPDPADTELTFTINYEWTHNDATVAGGESEYFTQQALAYGDTLACAVLFKENAEDDWQRVAAAAATVGNVAPMLAEASINPAAAYPGDLLFCEGQGYMDPDCGESGSFSYAWYVDGQLVDGVDVPTFTTDDLIGGQIVTCEVTPNDGNEDGNAVQSAPLLLEPDGFEIIGELPHSMAGFSVAIIDDINGDGYSELLIGAPNATPGPGRDRTGQVYVIYGKPSDEDVDLLDIAEGQGGFVFEGENGGLDLQTYLCRDFPGYWPCGEEFDVDYTSTEMATLEGPNGDGFGFTVAALGDLDADGIGDVMITAPFAYIEPQMYRGKAYAISGAKLATTSIAGIVSNASADGYVAVGEFGSRLEETNAGTTNFFPFNGDLLGWSGDSVGDVNGDGLADWAATSFNYGDEEQGKVYVFYGRDDGLAVDPTFAGDKEGVDGFWIFGKTRAGYFPTRYGMMTKGIGDFDGDGYDDILVHGAQLAAGSAYIVYGSEKGVNIDLNNPDAGLGQGEKSRISRFDGGQAQYDFVDGRLILVSGRDIAQWECGGGGDVNGDGLADIVFTSEAVDYPNEGLVVFGSEERGVTNLDDVEQGIGGFFLPGDFNTFAPWGEALIGGDFNADGLDDIVISSFGRWVQVIYGKTDTEPVDTDDTFDGIGGFVIMKPGNAVGYGMDADVGDINGDGLADLLIGSNNTSNERGNRVGGAYVRFGRDSEGLADFRGGDADDYFEGTAEAEVFISGRGNDILDGNGGADVLYAGAGDDVIRVADLDFRSIRAGRGFDTLVLESDGLVFDLSELRGRVRDIESIDLSGNGAQTLNIERLDLLRLSSSSNELVVLGDNSDTVGSFASRWFFEGIDERDGHEFYRLTNGHARLLIETDIQTKIAPGILTESMTIAENSPADTVVGTLETTDPDGEIVTYAIIDEHGQPGVFALNATTGEITVLDATALDFETITYFDLTVEITDNSGLSQSRKIRINLTDQSEPPVFTIASPTYFTEENADNGTVLGMVAAMDPDAGDYVRYRLIGEQSAPFNIGTFSGIINVMDNSLIDYETSTQHVFEVEAYDTSDQTARLEVTVDIGDAEFMETSGRLNFAINEQSMWQNGQPIEVTWPSDTTPMQWPEDPDSIPIPFPLTDVTFDWHGKVEVINEIEVQRGWYSAVIPMDVTIQVPDEIVPGQNMTITRGYALDRQNGRFWGETPGFDLRFGLQNLDDVGFTLEACFNDNCDPPITNTWDYTGPLTMLDHEVTPRTFSGSFNNDDFPSYMFIDNDVEFEVYDFEVDWDSYFKQALEYLGLPGNEGSYPVNDQFGNPFFAIDYLIYTIDLTTSMTYKQSSRLNVVEVHALITFEEADQTVDVILPSWQQATSVAVPANADANDDGRVEISIRFKLYSRFRSDITLTGSYGQKLTAGEFTVRSLKPHDSYAWFPPITKGPVIEKGGSVNIDDHAYPEAYNLGDLSNQPVWTGFLDVAN